MQNLKQTAWREQLEGDSNAVILDVRTDLEVAEGYIPNALHMDIQNAPAFMEKSHDLDKSKNYYVYCRAGSRSVQACMIMESLGFTNTFNLEGGYSEWEGETTS